jgi:hypothetical protein
MIIRHLWFKPISALIYYMFTLSFLIFFLMFIYIGNVSSDVTGDKALASDICVLLTLTPWHNEALSLTK